MTRDTRASANGRRTRPTAFAVRREAERNEWIATYHALPEEERAQISLEAYLAQRQAAASEAAGAALRAMFGG